MDRLFNIRVITFGFLALHLLVAWGLPLIEDEAYYALWASNLDWGYYDHPPMVAWMIALGETLLGWSEIGVRLVPVLAMGAIPLITWRLARLIGLNERAALLAALSYGLSILVLGLANFATPDAPSALFWVATLWAMVEAMTRKSLKWWIFAGALAGFGILSKFTNLFLAAGIVLWLIASIQGRQSARGAGPWVAMIVALITLIPLVWWNIANDWIGLERQFGRITTSEFAPEKTLTFVLTTLLVFSPILSVFALIGLRQLSGLLIWTSLPALAYLTWHSTQHEVAANWLIPLHPVFAIAAGAGLARFGARVRGGALILAGGLAVALLGAVFKPGAPLFDSHSPPNQIRGWDQTIAEIQREIETSGATWIATRQYGLTGQFWWYFPDTPVWSLVEPERYLFRGDLPSELCHQPGLLIERAGRDDRVAGLFIEASQPRQVTRTGGGVDLFDYQIRTIKGCVSDD